MTLPIVYPERSCVRQGTEGTLEGGGQRSQHHSSDNLQINFSSLRLSLALPNAVTASFPWESDAR